MIPFDNKVALRQLQNASTNLVKRNASRFAKGRSIAKDGLYHPRLLTLVCNHISVNEPDVWTDM
jgi:agmatinase